MKRIGDSFVVSAWIDSLSWLCRFRLGRLLALLLIPILVVLFLFVMILSLVEPVVLWVWRGDAGDLANKRAAE